MLWLGKGHLLKKGANFFYLSVDNLRIILIIGGMSRNIDYATTATYRLRTLGSDSRIQSGWHDWDVKSQETFNRFWFKLGQPCKCI